MRFRISKTLSVLTFWTNLYLQLLEQTAWNVISQLTDDKSNQIKSNLFFRSRKNNTQYKSIHIKIWHSTTEGMDGQTSWY